MTTLPPSMKLEAVVQDWGAALPAYREAMLGRGRTLPSCQTYATHLYRLAEALPDPWSVSPLDLSRWLARFAGRGVAYQRSAAVAVRSFYAWAYEVGHVESDPGAALAGRKLRPCDGFPQRWRPAVGRYVEAAAVGEKTLRVRLGYLRRFALDHPDPWTATPESVLAWVGRHSGGSSQNGARQALRAFYAFAHKTGLTGDDPASAALPRLYNGHQVQTLPLAWRAAIGDYQVWLGAAGVRPSTVRIRCAYVQRLARLRPDPATITERDLLGWLASGEWAAETRKSAAVSFRSFYKWAMRAGVVDHDPAAELPNVRVPTGRPRPAPNRIVDRAHEVATDRDRLMLLLATHAGLRRAEIAAVHPRDFLDGVLHVTGKGGRQRIVPVHPFIAEHVDAEIERRRHGRTGSGWRYAASRVSADDYLFPGQQPGSHVQAWVVGDALSQLLGEGWTAHTLRHRFASRAYAATRDLRAVQELLGHSSPTTTSIYTAVPDSAMRDAVMSL